MAKSFNDRYVKRAEYDKLRAVMNEQEHRMDIMVGKNHSLRQDNMSLKTRINAANNRVNEYSESLKLANARHLRLEGAAYRDGLILGAVAIMIAILTVVIAASLFNG